MRYYIAYGSNLNVEQMKFRCPDARIAGVSLIKDYRLMYKGSFSGAYLTIEKNKGSKVPVGIWAVSDSDELALDRYEGYPSFYYKAYVSLPVAGLDMKVRTLKAFVYIMHECREIQIPSQRYIDVCSRGYRDFGFDEKYLRDALTYSRANAGGRHENY